MRFKKTLADRAMAYARTDRDAAANIGPTHISEATNYRSLDRSYWMDVTRVPVQAHFPR